jgi:hypothetical protein
MENQSDMLGDFSSYTDLEWIEIFNLEVKYGRD